MVAAKPGHAVFPQMRIGAPSPTAYGYLTDVTVSGYALFRGLAPDRARAFDPERSPWGMAAEIKADEIRFSRGGAL